MNRKNKKLIIVAGASGEIGDVFLEKFSKLKNFDLIGISRGLKPIKHYDNLSWIHADLSKPDDLKIAFREVDFSKYKKVILIHSIGVDKFENTNFPKIEPLESIDSVVYQSNVNTYKYLTWIVIEKIEQARKNGLKIKLILSMLGSVADRHNVIFLTSFSESKNIVRAYIQNSVRQHNWISGLVINISSTITKSALNVRPHSDTTYWLTPEDVVEKAFPKLVGINAGYKEMDIFKKDPNFEKDYYNNHEKIYKRWSRFVWGNEK